MDFTHAGLPTQEVMSNDSITVRHSITIDGMCRLIEHLRGLGMPEMQAVREPSPFKFKWHAVCPPCFLPKRSPEEINTSHQLQTFFREKEIDPKIAFPQFYKAKFPDVAVTYQWSKPLDDLLEALEVFQKEHFKKIQCWCSENPLVEHLTTEEPTFWVDIFFVDQTGRKDVTEDLQIANDIYQNAFLHVALATETLLTRCWCINELAQRKKGITPELEAAKKDFGDCKFCIWRCVCTSGCVFIPCVSLPLMNRILRDKPHIRKRVVLAHRVTYWLGDHLDPGHYDDDFFGNMQASMPEDLAGIKELILKEYGSAEKFNAAMLQFVRVENTSDYDSSYEPAY